MNHWSMFKASIPLCFVSFSQLLKKLIVNCRLISSFELLKLQFNPIYYQKLLSKWELEAFLYFKI